jgi:hypothetical protein
MIPKDFTAAQAALFAFRHGRDNSLNGMRAMAFVLRNRAQAGWLNGDWLEIISKDPEVSATEVQPAAVFPDVREPSFQRLMHTIDDIFSGSEADELTSGALYFARLNEVDRTWFKEKILANPLQHWRVAQVGTITLFA